MLLCFVPWEILCFILMTGELLLLLMTTLVAKGDGSLEPVYGGCILQQETWITYDFLLIEWSVADEFLRRSDNQSDIEVIAQWHMEENYDNCSDVTMTSCKLIWHMNGSVNLNHDFYLTVTLATKFAELTTVTWPINIANCRQPPKIGNISVVPMNSSCLGVSWNYIRERKKNQYCHDLQQKTYRLSYQAVPKTNRSLTILKIGPTNSCQGNQIICGLSPYTSYDIGAECRNTEKSGSESGHWSDVVTASARTDEDVPSGAPEMTDGGFTYTRRDCNTEKTRDVDFFWKSIPEDFRNGKILGFKIDIYERFNQSGTLAKSYSVHGASAISSTGVLLCSTSYLVILKAFTAIGSSQMHSSMIVPSHTSVLAVDADVVPVFRKSSLDIEIRWVFHENVTFDVKSYTVYWCRKTLSGECQLHINWTSLPAGEWHYVFKTGTLSQPAHRYVFGISVQSNMSSSGILLSSCLYSEDTDVQSPANVHFMDYEVEGTLLAMWDMRTCEGAYILQYTAYLCVLDEQTADTNCSNPLMTKTVGGHQNKVLFSNLDTTRRYGVSIVARTLSGISSISSDLVIGQPFLKSSVQGGPVLVVIIVVVVVLGIILVTIVYLIQRRIRNRPVIIITDIVSEEHLHRSLIRIDLHQNGSRINNGLQQNGSRINNDLHQNGCLIGSDGSAL